MAGAAIVLAIAAAVLIARSSDAPEPVERQAQEVNASDRHLLNQATMLQRRRAASQGSDTLSAATLHQLRRVGDERQGGDVLSAATLHQLRRVGDERQGGDVLSAATLHQLRRVGDERFSGRYSQPAPESYGSDRHLLNQARKVE